MEQLSNLLTSLAKPLLIPFSPDQRIYYLYLVTALALAYLVYAAARDRGATEAQGGFLRQVFPKRIYTHRSAWTDYKFFLVNKIAYPLLLAPLVLGAAVAAEWSGALLAAIWGPEGPGFTSGPTSLAVMTVCLLVALDFGVFITHYLQHKVPALWEFHKVHHSAEVLTPITVYRMHPVDTLFTTSVSGALTGALHGLFAYLFAEVPGVVAVFGLNVGVFAFYLLGYNLRHSHIWLPYPRALSHLLISPAQHQIHHSDAPRHFDKNLGFIFAFWDWIAGTLYIPRAKEALNFGLYQGEHRAYDGVVSLYLLPFRRLFARSLGGERRVLRSIGVAAVTVLLVSLTAIPQPLTAPLPQTVYLEEMTWVEVREALARGKTTAIVPTGGVEQNGPHMVLGKHNYIVRRAAGAIAESLGDALVAPVMAYVPEGEVDPPSGHMAFAGTLSIPEPVFATLLEHTARSLRAHGFTTIAFVGDSGGNQAAQASVAAQLSESWSGEGVTVLHVGDYYAANGQVAWLKAEGESEATIGRHAGIRDSSELMAVYPVGIRTDRLQRDGGRANETTGVSGDPRRASAERGEALLRLKVDAAVRQIRAATGAADS
jgi:creatinine amidohydrolase/Fe(II)-dependent formamide hydrolase-like protein/sterol desaturase/sphingolipid hydroxylase (fatty acid hydroxylase superfamily)